MLQELAGSRWIGTRKKNLSKQGSRMDMRKKKIGQQGVKRWNDLHGVGMESGKVTQFAWRGDRDGEQEHYPNLINCY